MNMIMVDLIRMIDGYGVNAVLAAGMVKIGSAVGVILAVYRLDNCYL